MKRYIHTITSTALPSLFALFLSACTPSPKVQVIKPKVAKIAATVTSVTSGTVRAENVAELAFGTVGRVSKIHVSLGEVVEKEKILAELENQELATALDVSHKDYKRIETLSSQKLIAQTALDEARQKLEFARASFEKSLIRAPYNGLIGEMNLEVGQLSQITAINPRAPIKIIDRQPRYIRAEIDEVDLARVRIGMRANVTIIAVRREPFLGEVRLVVPYVNAIREQDRTCEVEIALPDSENLPVGASADVEILVEERASVLTVPSRAVLGRGDSRYLYTIDGNRLAKRAISRGIFNYESTEVLSGLSLDDYVVIPNEKSALEVGAQVQIDEEKW